MRPAPHVLAALLLVSVLGCRPKVSDTGYTGTWARGEPRARSVLSIVQRGDRFWFRLARSSQDEKWKVTCDWEGSCKEQIQGKIVAVFRFRWWRGDSGRLVVEQRGQVISPQKLDIHVEDEFVVQPGGLWLAAHSRVRDQQTYAVGRGPVVYFEKISDEVNDPPPGG